MSVKAFFRRIEDDLELLEGKLPEDWEQTTTDLILGLNRAKALGNSAVAITVAGLFPNGLGTAALNTVESLIRAAIPMLEIAEGAAQAANGLTGQAKADAVISYVVKKINLLHIDWQGKHWLNVAETILTELLGITSTEANSLINLKFGQLKQQ